MNLFPHNRNTRARARVRGLMLIECVVYLALFVVVLGLATKAFYDCWDSTKALGRDADDVVRSLQTGERWRADIRAATGPVETTSLGGVETLRIPQPSGAVVYTLANSELRRRAASAAEAAVMSNIKTSRMQSQSRGGVVVWRWELELRSYQRHARLRPLFTFEAVPTGGTPDEH